MQRGDTKLNGYEDDHYNIHQHIPSNENSNNLGRDYQNHIDNQDIHSSNGEGNSDLSAVDSVAAAQAAAAAAASLRGPYFDVEVSKNVIALVGKTASLTCRVKNLGNRTVSEILIK